jgi:hypothetical protein
MNDHEDLPIYRCPRIATPVRIDGDIHKPVWQSVPPHWLRPAAGAPSDAPIPSDKALFADNPAPYTLHPTPYPLSFQPTAFRACWTDTHLYIAFQCVDRDIWGTCARRDDPLYEEEVVEAFLAPTGDVRYYYEFEVSPRNIIFDASVHSPDLNRRTMRVDTAWNCPGLQTAVRLHGPLRDTPPNTRTPEHPNTLSRWWSVEIAIPFAAFHGAGSPRPDDAWRANFYRIDRAEPPEFTAWSPTLEDPPNFHVPERFGFLVFGQE